MTAAVHVANVGPPLAIVVVVWPDIVVVYAALDVVVLDTTDVVVTRKEDG